jgi:hypothetical protein
MRAILIDPRLRRVVNIALKGDDDEQLKAMHMLIRAETLNGGISINTHRDQLWLDDLGAFAQPSCFAFRLHGSGPFCGIGIIIGTSGTGKTQEPVVSAREIEAVIDWLDEIIPEVHIEDSSPDAPIAVFRQFVTYKRVKG